MLLQGIKPNGKILNIGGVEYSEVIDFASAPFPINEEQVAIMVDYKNPAFIADLVSPRIRTGKQEFTYRLFDKKDGLTIPNTKANRKGHLNQVEFGGTEETSKTLDYGLMTVVPQGDIQNSDNLYNPVNHHTQKIAELVALDRESRVAAQVFGASNYGSSNKVTLDGSAGKKQWDDYTDSNPVGAILAAKDIPVMKPNILVLGQKVWTKVRQHPVVVEGIYGSGAKNGIVRLQDFADFLELEQVLVGQAFYNSANKGQTGTYARLWGNYAALVYRENNPVNTQMAISQFFTAQFGDPLGTNYPVNPGAFGLYGGQAVVAGESVKEVCTATDFGYLWSSVLASY